MDAWMQVPGARVQGHKALVHGNRDGSFAVCTCGFQSQVTASIDNSCLALVDHLQRSVRAGAAVLHGDDGGEAGVREPRRPQFPPGSLFAQAEIPSTRTG